MKHKKNLIYAMIVLTLFICIDSFKMNVQAETSSQTIQIMVDDELLTDLPTDPVIVDGHTLVPARQVFEAMGAVVDWKEKTKEVYIGYEETIIILKIDSPYANVNGQEVQMDVPAQMINETTMIPLRFVSETLGFKVEWFEEEQLIKIYTETEEEIINIEENENVESEVNIDEETTDEETTDLDQNSIPNEEPQNIYNNENIYIDTQNRRFIIPKNENYPINLEEVQYTEYIDYNNREATFTLPSDYTEYLGSGKYYIDNEDFNYIEISNNDENKTQITFYSYPVFAYTIEEDVDNIYINYRNPKEVYPMVVVIDAGHGGVDPGTSNGSLLEKDIVFDIANKTTELLEQDPDIKVYQTRITDDKIELADRVAFANEIGDLFVSIHINSAGSNQSPNGTEVYYYTHSNDAEMGITSEEVAEIFQENLIEDLGTASRGVKKEEFYVIKYTTIPAVLLEIDFISNPQAALNLASEEYRQLVANSIYRSIKEVSSIYTPPR